MSSSDNSHNGQSTNGSLKLPVGWFERIVLSCDFFAVHCGEGVTGVKLHCASCKRLKMYQLYHRSLWAWLQLIFYRISLGFDFLYASFVWKKKKSTTANYPVQFISSQFEVEICMLKKTNKNPPNTIHNNNKSFFAPQRMWHRSLDILQLNPQIALRLWCWKQRLRCDVVHFANRGLSTWEALQWWGNSCTLIILWATVVLC